MTSTARSRWNVLVTDLESVTWTSPILPILSFISPLSSSYFPHALTKAEPLSCDLHLPHTGQYLLLFQKPHVLCEIREVRAWGLSSRILPCPFISSSHWCQFCMASCWCCVALGLPSLHAKPTIWWGWGGSHPSSSDPSVGAHTAWCVMWACIQALCSLWSFSPFPIGV